MNRRRERVVNAFGHDYSRHPEDKAWIEPHVMTDVNKLLWQRLDAKLERDFPRADELLAELGQLGVAVNDGSKEWRADGKAFKRQWRRVGGGRDGGIELDVAEIDAMLAERDDARKARDYEIADDIFEALYDEFGVMVDDKTRTWSVDARAARRASDGGGRSNRRGGGSDGKGHDYSRDPWDEHELSDDEMDWIDDLLARRLSAKKGHRFEEADALQNKLRLLGVETNDREREWRIAYFKRNKKPRREE